MADTERLRSTLPTSVAALKADIEKGLIDVGDGRMQDFDASRIIERGRRLLAGRVSTAS